MKSSYFIIFALAWFLSVFVEMAFYLDLKGEEYRIIAIPYGTPIKTIAQLLEEEGVALSLPLRFFMFLSAQEKVIAGRYLLRWGTPVTKVVERLVEGPPRDRITFPEEITAQQMADILEKRGICSRQEYIEAIAHPEVFDREWLAGVASLEGFLFPDTYLVPIPSTSYQVVEMQLSRSEELILPLYRNSDSPLSLQETVTLASIIEKEAKDEEEKPYIASVFFNRLKKGMKLQSCATVIYAHYRENGVSLSHLQYQDLKIDSPFNTYIHHGLPPQAIGNPGFASLYAALHPKPTDYLYFVLLPEGRHAFSSTYDEHLAKKGENDGEKDERF